jgi:uncharacterized YccA/Bax inhibitor family protein
MSNPILSEKSFEDARQSAAGTYSADVMTMKGTINKSILLFLTMLVPAAWIWWKMGGNPENAQGLMGYMIGSAILGFILSMVLVFKKSWAPFLAPAYAAVEGVFIGLISMVFNYLYDGIVMQAVGITLLIFTAMLLAYKTGLLRATPMFTKVIVMATMGVALFYLINMIVSWITGNNWYAGNGTLSIIVSAVVAGIAAFNLILDFNMIEENSKAGAPKYMEWFCAFGLLVTIVWLYLEILRLMAKLSSRD